MLSKVGRAWCKRAALTEKNRYMAAELLYIYFGESQPCDWREITEHWRLFKEA